MIKKIISFICITPIYWFGCLMYKKEYLQGRYFDRKHFTKGWGWILKYWYKQKVVGINRDVPFPVPGHVSFSNAKNIVFDPNDMAELHSLGGYFQAVGANIYLGKNLQIGPGVGIFTANHDFYDIWKHQPGEDVIIGDGCWIGMNVCILPGVNLGPHTIVGAGSVVTKSFTEGNCIIAGNPARIIRHL